MAALGYWLNVCPEPKGVRVFAFPALRMDLVISGWELGLTDQAHSFSEFMECRTRLVEAWCELNTAVDAGLVPDDKQELATRAIDVIGDILTGHCDSEELAVF